MTTPDFRPTHVVPQHGMPAWEAPDPARPTVDLDPLLPVQLLERQGDWGHVLCFNGWSAWVDGRRLVAVPLDPPAADGPLTRAADPRPLLGRAQEALARYRSAVEDLAGGLDRESFRTRTHGMRIGVVIDGESVWLYDSAHGHWVYADGSRTTTYATDETPAAEPESRPAHQPARVVPPEGPADTPPSARSAPAGPTRVVPPEAPEPTGAAQPEAPEPPGVAPPEAPEPQGIVPAAPEPTRVVAPGPPEPTRVVSPQAPEPLAGVSPDAPEPTRVVTPDAPEPTRVVSPDAPEPTRVVSPDAPEPERGSPPDAPEPTRVVTPDAPEPTRVVSPDAPEPTRVVSADAPEPTRVVSPDASEPTRVVSPEDREGKAEGEADRPAAAPPTQVVSPEGDGR
ncbi:hypothetical protein ABZ178_38650 [Streptomyces massasporeus]|uniref:hypothetical protein n=1 Tax=Streptomyces massasporeus TaxID=67324 RepID=UPI0033ABE019